MSEQRQDQQSFFLKRKWLRRLLFFLAAIAALLVAVVLAIPAMVSSDWARNKVEQALSASTGKDATVRQLSFGWSEGLNVGGLNVGQGGLDDEAFLCSLETLSVKFDFLKALRKDMHLTVSVSGLRLRQIVEPTPPHAEPQPTELPKPLPKLLRDSLSALRQGLKPSPRSGDAHILVDVSDIEARLIFVADNSTLDIRDVTFRLSVPGLANGPVRLNAGFKTLLNGKELAPLKLEALLEGLVDETGQLNPAQARLKANAEAPGVALLALGSVGKGFKTDLRVDLRKLAPLLKPFVGSALPDVSGALAIGLTAAQPDTDHLNLGLVAFVDSLRAAGGPLGPKSAGPFAMNLLQEASVDLKTGAIQLPGKLRLLNKSTADWQGEVTGLNESQPKLNLNVHPIHLQLDELMNAARAWIPPGISIAAATLDIQSMVLQAALPTNAGGKLQALASLKDLNLEAKNVTRTSGQERLSIARSQLVLETAQVELPGKAPGQLSAKAMVTVEGLRQQGKTPVSVKRMALTHLAARVDGLAQDSAGLFGVLGAAALDITGEVQGIDIPKMAQVPSLKHTVTLRADLPATKSATARLEALTLDAPRLRVLLPGKRPVDTPLALHLSVPDISLSDSSPMEVGIADAKLTLELGQALRLLTTSSMQGKAVRSSGTMTLDVQRLLALATPLLPSKAQGSGGVALDWKLSAVLPQPQGPVQQPVKLSKTLARLDFLKELEAVLTLTDVNLDWPKAGTAQAGGGKPGDVLRLRSLSTPKPLRVNTSGGLRESSLRGSLAFGPLDELPGVGALAKPLRGLVTVNAAQQGLRSLQLSEILHTDGLELDQSLNIALDRLDQVLDRDKDRFAAILEHVDGTISFAAKTGLATLSAQAGKAQAAQKLSGKGNLEAGFDAKLSSGRSLALSARLLSPGLDLNLGPNLAISGLTSSLRLNKRYALQPGLRCAGPSHEVLQPLSEQVFDLFPSSTPSSNFADDDNAVAHARLSEFQAGGGSLGFSRMKLKSGSLPLALHDVFLRLDTSGPLPALRSFRAGLLGGNMLGSLQVKGARGDYALAADLSFTGIDPSRFFPGKAAKDLGDKAETAGRVSVTLPLTPDAEALLQRIGLRADITKIGPRTLERMLYALDPDEQNETIVQQRRLMDIGYPRFVNLGLAYGNLSLSGAVEVKGFQLDLPRIDRLPVGNLPIGTQLRKALAPMPKLIKTLDAVSSNSLCRDPAGSLKVSGNNDQEGVAP